MRNIRVIIGRDYLLKKPAGPSAPKLFLDTRVVPLAVNVAGGLEVALDRTSTRIGVRPAVVLAGVVGIASVTLLRLLRGPARAGRARRPSSRPPRRGQAGEW